MMLISGLTSTSTTLGGLLVLPQCLTLVDLLEEPLGGEMWGNGVNLNIEDDEPMGIMYHHHYYDEGEYHNTSLAHHGDRGSKLPELPSGTLWKAGGTAEVMMVVM